MAGVQWARQVLDDDARRSDVDHLREPWAVPLPPIPLDNGEIEIEYAQNVNEGGVLPPVLLNIVGPMAMFAALPKLQGFLDREAYRDAKLAFIKER